MKWRLRTKTAPPLPAEVAATLECLFAESDAGSESDDIPALELDSDSDENAFVAKTQALAAKMQALAAETYSKADRDGSLIEQRC